ncbi:hypothetical protein MY04_3432 [Flammeovirga sp. MY04]|uniref:hypothetical protein n=1 Tax=Flammeovirga sp. MY04 TaxID=1191459 RepID=UPI00080626E2|nr:hypothetical protein [Flammeovirga sp. MY04]ANQ50786.1 hypothetical protein MY04_3432 [Flammeovirga sp. MY04]
MRAKLFKHLFLLSGFFFTISSLYAQNLIPNPSFESFHEETRGHAYLDNLEDWFNANSSKPKSLYGTPDHLFINEKQPLKGIKDSFKPRTGTSVLGLISYMQRVSDYREYASVRTSTPLQKGEKYQFTCYIKNGNQVAFGAIATNGFGVYFSENKIRQYVYEPLNVTPQYQIEDIFYTTEWKKITFTFTAEDNYKYMTIGNFLDDVKTDIKYINYDVDPQCYVYVDDVSLIHIPTDKPEEEKEPEEEVIEEVPEVVAVAPVEEKIKEEPVQEKKKMVYENRPTTVQSSIYITSYEINLAVWDDKTVDGDIVSLFWNGETILEEYELTAKKKKLKIRYEPGKENILILYAHNLGKEPPNTMAIYIKAGKKKRQMSIRSTLGKSGGIRFKR